MAKLLFSLLIAFSSAVHARLIQPNDEPYYSLQKEGTLYIYDSHVREFIGSLEAYGQSFRPAYESLFGWKLDEEADYILLSPRSQIANAFATTFPNVKTIWAPSGAGMLESMALSSWALTLQAHEGAHLYQLNPRGRVGRALKPFFGNPLYLLPFIPVFPAPNFLLPTSILEGNAVLNESRLNFGGRLHSGERRALMLAAIADGQITPSRLINDQFKFPFGEGAYLFGGYFQAHLAGKYGIEKTNSFFAAHAEHIFNPLRINETFRRHFGASYYQEVHEFVHGLKPLAAKQRAAGGDVLLEATFMGPLNHDSGRIWWLASQGYEPPKLYVFDKSTRRLESRRLDIPMGKVYFDGTTPLVSSSQQHDLHNLEYSLYGESERFDPRFRGQIVTDWRAGHSVALSATASWLEGQVLKDGEPFDVGHSNPILDGEGRAYYFRQNGLERILYRDRLPIARYDGFYGKLTETAGANDVYFIGNSDFGASLFRWTGQEIERMTDSDRVTDARRIGDDEFLLLEVGARGYRVVTSRVYRKAERPAVYSYAYSTQNIMPAPAADTEQTLKDEKPYSALREMRYSELNFATAYSSHDGLRTNVMAAFRDPLEYQQFVAGGVTSEFAGHAAVAEYSYTRYLPELFLRYTYSEDPYKDFAGVHLRTHDNEGQLGVRLPVLRHQRWDAGLSFAAAYRDKEQSRELGATDRTHINTYGLLSGAQLRYEVPSTLGLYPWREFQFDFRNVSRADTLTGRKDEDSSLVSMMYRHGLPKQFFVMAMAAGAWAEADDIPLEYNQMAVDSDIRLPRLSSQDTVNVRSAGLLRLEVQKSFTLPAYPTRFPVGLNRLAPIVAVQGIVLDDDPLDRYHTNIFEYGFGVDAELLVLHRFPLRTRILIAVDPAIQREKDAQFTLNMKKDF